MDPALVEAAITPRTKALLPVHLYGLMADMDPLVEIAERYGLISSRMRPKPMAHDMVSGAPASSVRRCSACTRPRTS